MFHTRFTGEPSGKPKRTPAFTPGAAGPWMWAAVCGATSPENVTKIESCVSASLSVNDPVPVAGDELVGTSCAELRVAWNCRAADAEPGANARTTRRPMANKTRKRMGRAPSIHEPVGDGRLGGGPRGTGNSGPRDRPPGVRQGRL